MHLVSSPESKSIPHFLTAPTNSKISSWGEKTTSKKCLNSGIVSEHPKITPTFLIFLYLLD